jgi:hypothetical protein
MERITEFWNTIPAWVKLFGSGVLVICTLVSVTNASLNLRSRYKDWRAIRTKATFERRLKQLAKRFWEVRRCQLSTRVFLDEILRRLMPVVSYLVIGLAAFAMGSLFGFGFRVLSAGSFLGALSTQMRLWRFVLDVVRPELTTEIIQFIQSGIKSGLIHSETDIVTILGTDDMYNALFAPGNVQGPGNIPVDILDKS